MTARKNKVKTVGYLHSSIWKRYLSQFIGKEEAPYIPLPDRIVTPGSHSAELYKCGGIPEEKLVVGGAWRYPHSADYTGIKFYVSKKFNVKPKILISLCWDLAISRSMLECIKKFSKNSGLDERVEFLVKPHPGNVRSTLNKLRPLISKYKIVEGSLSELIKDVDVVISSESNSGLEAYLHGKKAISFLPENIITSDALLDITDKRVFVWHEGEGIDMNFLKDINTGFTQEQIDSIKANYFEKVDHDTWLDMVNIEF